MNGKYYLGKCDGYGNGRKSCKAFVTWSLEDQMDGALRFSAQGEIWNSRETDIISGGQNLEELLHFFPTNLKLHRIVKVWRRWHLNDMRAGCEHQRAEHWGEEELEITPVGGEPYRRLSQWVWITEDPRGVLLKPCPVCGYKYGSSWLYEPIPEDVLAEIRSW